jgi:hypothetical protein
VDSRQPPERLKRGKVTSTAPSRNSRPLQGAFLIPPALPVVADFAVRMLGEGFSPGGETTPPVRLQTSVMERPLGHHLFVFSLSVEGVPVVRAIFE